jgi:hypothetical protein
MAADASSFFSACLSAGAILTGFCGTFLAFRIQREASYYRQPAVDFTSEKGKDVYLGLSHFSSPFLLLIVASLLAVTFGFALPLLALADIQVRRDVVVAGILAALVFLVGYFACELRHYGILNQRLLNDRDEWGRAWGTVCITAAAALLACVLVFVYV